MPYLNWTEKSMGVVAKPLDRLRAELELELGAEEIRDLSLYLEEIYVNHGGELRLQLNSQWVLFWKRREEGNRVLMAHPEENEWVGTVALEDQASSRLLLLLKEMKPGEVLSLRQIGEFASVSNLELRIGFRE